MKINKEKQTLSEIYSALDYYEIKKLKNGRTINIDIINKHKGGSGKRRESFRTIEDAIEWLQKFVILGKNDE